MDDKSLIGSICLSDIPKELITKGRNGKSYITVFVSRRKDGTIDKYGYTHYIKMGKPEGSGIKDTPYIGNMKPFTPKYKVDGNNSQNQVQDKNVSNDVNDDLPF